MTADEARQTFDELASILEESGLQWIVDGVNRQIAAGKTVRKTVRVASEEVDADWELTPVRRRKVSARFLGSDPYSQDEQLLLLLEVMQQVVVAATQMSAAVIAETDAHALEFIDEGRETASVRVEPGRVSQGADAAERLTTLLEELRRETSRA